MGLSSSKVSGSIPISYEDDPLYFIFKREIPGRVRMHTRRLKLHNWVYIDKTYKDQMALKYKLLEEDKKNVYITNNSPVVQLAKFEVLELLMEHLPERFPNMFQKVDNGIHNIILDETYILSDLKEDPLIIASRLVQDDWCIMEWQEEHQQYVFAAGVVCFPMRWSIHEKFELPMSKIHVPVKAFNDFSGNVMSIFRNMKPERPVHRGNWAVFNDLNGPLDLFTPTGHESRAFENTVTEYDPKTTGQQLTFRVEYQTLRKLPKSKCILFGIRTYQRYIEEFQLFPKKDIKALIKAIETIDSRMAIYKGMEFWKDAALKYLRSIMDGTVLPMKSANSKL